MGSEDGLVGEGERLGLPRGASRELAFLQRRSMQGIDELLDVRVFIANISSPSYQTLPQFEQYYSARDTYGPLVSPPLPPTQPLSPAFWHNLTVAFENNDAAFQLYNERLSRSGMVQSCTGDCKTTTICGLRAARSENNCVRLFSSTYVICV